MTGLAFVEGNVEVDGNLFTIGEKSYAISSINSVNRKTVDRTEPWEHHKIIIFVWVLVAIVIALMAVEKGGNIAWIVIPIAGIAYSIYRRFAIKVDIQHVLLISTSSGQIEALSSNDAQLILRVQNALTGAIQQR